MPTIDELQIEITHSSEKAVSGIDGLIDLLTRLKGVTRGGVGLTSVANQLRKLNDAISGIKDPTENIQKLVSALKPLESIQKTNLNSTLNSLKKLPEITQQLSEIDMDGFASQIERVTTSIRPLADEMNKVAAGFSAFPKRIQRLITQNERLSTSNIRTSRSFGVMGTGISQLKVKLGVLYFALRRVARTMADWVVESNNYVENLNLFRLTMRDASDEALGFANKVHDAFGIDPSEWIRFQAVFQNMATGFGIAADKATVMSKNLTQLGYDLSTVFNVNYEVAMQKLQSALAGQPRPMREWGFDMSEATLKLAALRHGIEANVEKMTQYEKSQIRYLQIMETAKRQGVMGNFAREIHTPANAMRILNQQLLLFRRELGNMIIPLLMNVLPYLQAFVKILTDAARALAALFGFELPIIDYSGLGDMPPLIDDIEEGFGGATGAAKKFKNLLMGFDEINLLPSPDSATGGGSSGGGIGGGGLEIDPSIYDYDFLGNISNKVNEIVDKIYEKVTPFINFIKDNFDHIKDVALAIGAGLLAWKLAPAVESLFSIFRGHSSPVLGIALTIGGIVLGTTGIANLVAGQGDVIDVIKAVLGAALGIGGSLIAFGTGPTGWMIGVSAVLTMTIAGFVIGTNRRIDALIQEAISSNGGTLISELADAFSNLMEKIGRGYDPIIEGGEKLKTVRNNVEDAKKALHDTFNAISVGAGTTEESIEKISNGLKTLLDSTQDLRDTAYDNIVYALSTSLKDTAESMGIDVSNILLELDKLKSDSDKKMADYKSRLEEINKEYKKTGDVEKYTKSTKKLANQFGINNSMTHEVDSSFKTLMVTLGKIDWEEPGERAKALKKIGESANQAREKVNTAFDAIIENLTEFRKTVTDPKDQMMIDELISVTERARSEAMGRITDNLNVLFGGMQRNLTSNIADVAKKANDDWEAKGPIAKLFGGSKEEYIARAIMAFKNKTMDPIAKEVQGTLSEFGIDGGSAMSKAVDNIMRDGFVHGISGAGPYVAGFGEDVWKLVQRELTKIERNVRLNPLKLSAKINITNPVIKTAGTGVRAKIIGKLRAMEYASGGFPDVGELFVAREAGPEMVGSIGGRTSVANNDQIVSAVSEGVAKAVSKVMGKGDSSGDVVFVLNGNEFGRLSKQAINNYNRQTGDVQVVL